MGESMTTRYGLLWAALVLALAGSPALAADSKLDAALKGVKVPPDWLAETPTSYDTRTPWKDARLHIRKLLGEGKNREAIKLTYIYHAVQKNGSPDGHEYPMYLYLGGEYAWAAKAYAERLRDKPQGHTDEYAKLASLCLLYGEHQKAIETLQDALERLPEPPWRINATANLQDKLGDAAADKGDFEKAREHYNEAIRLYPTSNQPYGRHLLQRNAAKVQAKLDLLNRKTLDIARIKDGVYRGTSLGYAKDMTATVTVRGGKITDIRLQHEEKIEQGATKTVPAQIIERQSLQVDAITGATVTVQAVVEATWRALQKGGLK